jgi:hypothetical protein
MIGETARKNRGRGWLLPLSIVLAALILASGAVGGAYVWQDTKPEPDPIAITVPTPVGDVVVGVRGWCYLVLSGNVMVDGPEGSVGCKVPLSLRITVRTGSGQTYELELPPNTRVAIGDKWPK